MDYPILIAAVLFIALLFFLATGIWVAVAISLVSVAGFFIFVGNSGLTPYVPFNTLNSFVLTAIPLFVFMGELLMVSGISDGLYKGMNKCLSWIPGGLLHSNIGSCALFAAISGSSVATAATIGTVALPELEKRGYNEQLACGSLAAGGTLGILIPPSGTMIVYGMLADTSVGRLFAGGVIPGIIMAVCFMTYIYARVVRNPALAPREKAPPLWEILGSLKDIAPTVSLMVIVLGGIFSGFVTPTEGAALGAFAAMIMALCVRRLTWATLKEACLKTLEISSMVLFLVAAAFLFTSLCGVLGIPDAFSKFVVGLGWNRYLVLSLIYLLYLFLGCFIDGTCAMIMTSSVVIPLVTSMGFDLVWFGVMMVVLIEIGLLTPPFGINLFVIQGISGKPLTTVTLGSWPFFLVQILCIILYTAFPDLVLVLPNFFFGK
jgi:tripartite ATP-independent transporter DctM subunit